MDPLAHPVIAHRGASGRFPENTMLAFEEAIRDGADAVEFDVQVTGDGVPVVIHDATVDRTTNGHGRVSSHSLTALQQLDAGSGQRIPALDDVLGTFVPTPLLIEVKTPAGTWPVLAALGRTTAADRVMIGSFDHAVLRPFRDAGIATAASRRETARVWALSRVGVTGGASRSVAFTVPEHWHGLRVVDRRFVGAALNAGKPVHVWTVDEPGEAEGLLALGVSGIMTNFPERFCRLPWADEV